MSADLTIPQAWSRAVQGYPAGFQAIKYASQFLDQPCLVQFDRGGLPARLQVTALGSLRNLETAVDWLENPFISGLLN